MNKTTLVIMAAGMGSRYGGGIKQLEHVGPSGEIIMDYSIYDAKQAGFDKVVFIIRKDLEKDFKEIIGNRIEKEIEVEYVYQELDALPEGFEKPADRTKPWGTGHAILNCLGTVKEPFMVINADDYYGKEAFQSIHAFLCGDERKASKGEFCMAGFIIGNTLSENGVVTRGICNVDINGMLETVEEGFDLKEEDGQVTGRTENGKPLKMPMNTPVSMNMWGFTPDFLESLQGGFIEFLKDIKGKERKAEYLLPEVIGSLVREKKASVKVLSTNDRWFGVTYKEDKDAVVAELKDLVSKGVYPDCLYKQ